MDYDAANRLIIPHGKHGGKSLGKIPSWYLKWLSQSWSDVTIREGARAVLDGRARLGIPEKPKRAKKTPDSLPIPENVQRNELKPVSFSVQNANLSGKDAF